MSVTIIRLLNTQILSFLRCRPSPSYLAQYPVPPKEMQPPNLPLHDSHSMNYIYPELFSGSLTETSTRSFSVLAGAENGRFALGMHNYIFRDDRKEVVPTWYTINVSLPLDNTGTTSFDTDGTFSWSDFVGLRASTYEPLFNVHHELAISLAIQYDLESGEVVKEKLSFKVPLTFANVAPPPPSPNPAASIVQSDAATSRPILPAYSQLYHRNGERKIDYSVPLPLYTPKPYNGGDSEGCKDNNERDTLLVGEEKCLFPAVPLLARQNQQA